MRRRKKRMMIRYNVMKSLLWNIIYTLYPPVLRVLEKLKIHNTCQPYHLGYLDERYTELELRRLLEKEGFEDAILAWKDPDEILSMRKIDNDVFQYHIRLFADGELRGHYEYSSEGNPWGHIREKCFEPREEYFQSILGDFLISQKL